LIIGGLGAGAAVGIAGVTRLTFAGSASDPDGDVLSYQWSFGDGATASGDTVEHVFQHEGQFEVALQTITGTLRCSVCFGLSGCVCNGERPFTLTRQ